MLEIFLYSKKILTRWISLYWDKFKERTREKFPGSMAYAINNSWYDINPQAMIYRRWTKAPNHIIPCVNATLIESFTLDPIAIQEFVRVWR